MKKVEAFLVKLLSKWFGEPNNVNYLQGKKKVDKAD
jgi:hypothetical protein